MSDVVVIPSAAVEALRRKAKKLRKEQGMPHHAALDAVARCGRRVSRRHHFIEAAKATEPAEEAPKHGLVIGMDIKGALEVPAAKVVHFLEDERLRAFVFDYFDLHPTGGLGEDEDYLRAVVDEIRVEGNAATISGSYERLIAAVANKKEASVTVPTFLPEWRAWQDSNPRPLGS